MIHTSVVGTQPEESHNEQSRAYGHELPVTLASGRVDRQGSEDYQRAHLGEHAQIGRR